MQHTDRLDFFCPLTGGLVRWQPEPTPPQAPPTDTAKEVASSAAGAPPRVPLSVAKKDKQDGVFGIDVLGPPNPTPVKSTLSLEDKVRIASSVGVECIQPEELRALLEKTKHPVCYDGFEPSGRMHIAQGVLKAMNVNKLTSCGCVFVFWVADWFALLNNKMDGDLNKIRLVGQYFIEIWSALGMDMRNVRFLWAAEEIGRHPDKYWELVMNIARANSISRIKRCSQIMGRSEGDEVPSAQVLYPCMQCADVFYLKADICQLGLDQRKVNVLAREYCDVVKQKNKPVILSHGMVSGLLEGQAKMSKSDPESAIFMEDSEQDVKRKIKKAFCPPQVIAGNPAVEYVETFIFGKFGEFDVDRREKDGGPVVYKTVEEFREAYESGALHPADLKTNLAAGLNRIIDPVRRHFQEDPYAAELLKMVQNLQVTR